MKQYFGYNIRQYFKHFYIRFILVAILIIVGIIVSMFERKVDYYDSPNKQRVYGDQRIFDYADKLTDDQEKKLAKYISEAEKKTCLDIVIVTLDESLRGFVEDYMDKYNLDIIAMNRLYGSITPDKYVEIYADEFWETGKFGYDQAQVLDGTTRTGDGVLLVDNLHREEETGKIYTWMCTTGKAERRYSSSMIDRALDCFYENVEEDYYQACIDYIDCVVRQIGPTTHGFPWIPLVVALIVVLIYNLVKRNPADGDVTVTPVTYLDGGHATYYRHEDIFIRKDVTRHYNPPSSSSGGGHSSGGGGHHGGGGHSR